MKRSFRLTMVAAIAALGLASTVGALAAGPTSVWEGVYSSDQAVLGGSIYPSVCGRCHGFKLDGAPDDPDMFPSPPIAGTKFLRNWNGRSLAALFNYTRTTMPENNPGFLSDQEFIAIVAYMLAMSEMPSGSAALPAEAILLDGIAIEPQP